MPATTAGPRHQVGLLLQGQQGGVAGGVVLVEHRFAVPTAQERRLGHQRGTQQRDRVLLGEDRVGDRDDQLLPLGGRDNHMCGLAEGLSVEVLTGEVAVVLRYRVPRRHGQRSQVDRAVLLDRTVEHPPPERTHHRRGHKGDRVLPPGADMLSERLGGLFAGTGVVLGLPVDLEDLLRPWFPVVPGPELHDSLRPGGLELAVPL